MFQKNRVLLFCLFSFFSLPLLGNLTTMQHFDPSPRFNAANNTMPMNGHLHQLTLANKKDMKPYKKRAFSVNLSGFVQGACRAWDCSGCNEFGSICGQAGLGTQMGDFRGTLYPMGLFLGSSPNGKNIWQNGTDTGDATDITQTSIDATELPSCLKTALSNMTQGGTAPEKSILFSSAANETSPSIFSEQVVSQDPNFGAFSTPLEYKKYGFRIELCGDFSEHVSLVIQTGVSNIKQRTSGLSSLNTSGTVYSGLQFTNTAAAAADLEAQKLFDDNLTNNLDKLFDKDCGINYDLCNFDEFSIEDVRLFLLFKTTYDMNRCMKGEDHPEDWAASLFTPYMWVGGTFPAATEIDYTKGLSLPFGNNGHFSIGSGVGFTFDFVETVEVGVEGGITYFFSKEETRPFPNHDLQRLVYPFNTTVTTEPGRNWHAKVLLNAYQFLPHVSFHFNYEFIEHTRDKYTFNCGSSGVFKPEVLECCSDWRAQFFNVGLVFDIQPCTQFSFFWQQPISPRNAYYPVTVMGSLNFLF